MLHLTSIPEGENIPAWSRNLGTNTSNGSSDSTWQLYNKNGNGTDQVRLIQSDTTVGESNRGQSVEYGYW